MEPMKLNERNSGYGNKEGHENAWKASIHLVFGGGGFRSIKDALDAGGYSTVIDECIKGLNRFKTIESLERLNEADLASFYMLGEAYFKSGIVDKAIGCFQVVYSQIGFRKYMLSSPVKFSNYPELAGQYLDEISKESGESAVTNYDIKTFLQDVIGKKIGGCFIATACYGTDTAPEVLTLRDFRDSVLLSSKIGRAFVKIYYLLSPPIAKIIASHYIFRSIVRQLFIQPIASLCRSKMKKN